ncbi:MAG: LytR/AlgR family response regulator transcription factor [Thermoanaerobaculia bacterium]
MTYRAIVVDDEALGRRGVVSRLEKSGSVEVVAACANGREAIDSVRRLRPDLLFLDVQMPGLSGFDVLAAIGEEERPHVVFVTAFDRYAVRAFEVHALDYLLKPIDEERFAETLARALRTIARERDGEIGRRVASVVGEMISREGKRRTPAADHYVVRSKGRMILVRHAEIDWVQAEGDYVKLHAGTKAWLVRETMAGAEKTLGPRKFLRIHRSTIVNVDRVQELRSFENGDYAVLLRDGTELRLSRTFRAAIDRLTGPGA